MNNQRRALAVFALAGALFMAILVSSSGTRSADAQGVLTPGGRGTITAVYGGSGLTGSATSGSATLNVGAGSGITVGADAISADTTYLQRRLGECSAGSAVQSYAENGTPTCVIAGDITGITAGSGMTGDATSGAATLAVGATSGGGLTLGADSIGMRTDCSPTQGLAWDGDSWECSALGSTYTAGDGLTLTGTDFDVNVGTNLTITADTIELDLPGSSCPDGQAVTALTSDGTSSCGTVCIDVGNACGGNTECCTGNCNGGVCAAGGSIDGTGSTSTMPVWSDSDTLTHSVEVSHSVTTGASDATAPLAITHTLSSQDVEINAVEITIDGLTGNAVAPMETWALDITADVAHEDTDKSHTNGGLRITATSASAPSNPATGIALRVEDGLVQFLEDVQIYGSISDPGGNLAIGDSVDVTGSLTATGSVSAGTTVNATGQVNAGSLGVTGDSTLGSDSSDTLTVNATATMAQLRGTKQTSTSTGSLADFALDDNAAILYFSNSGGQTFSGLAGGADGRLLWVYSAGAITFAHENGGSTAANRFELASSSNWAFTARTPILLIYDGAASRWRVSKDGAFSTATISGTLNANATVSLGSSDSHVTSVRMPKDSGTAPTLSSCGTSPTVTGGSWAFRITAGTGGITACTATFAATKTATPTCIASIEDVAEEIYVSAISATAVTITAKTGTADISSNVIDVICIGDA